MNDAFILKARRAVTGYGVSEAGLNGQELSPAVWLLGLQELRKSGISGTESWDMTGSQGAGRHRSFVSNFSERKEGLLEKEQVFSVFLQEALAGKRKWFVYCVEC